MKKHVVTISVTALTGALLLSGGAALALINSGEDSPVSSSRAEPSATNTAATEAAPSATETAETSATAPSASASNAAPRQLAEVEIIPAQNGGEYYGTPVPFDPNKPRYDLQHGGNPYATYDQSQSDATATTSRVDSVSNEKTTNPSQIIVTYPGQ